MIMQDRDNGLDSASDFSEGEWEQPSKGASGPHGGHHLQQQGHQAGQDDYNDPDGKKGGKKDLSHVACRFYRVGACTAREPGSTKPVCKWFQKGGCKFGHKCANAHIMPGDLPSMDWKNKKAAKLAAHSDACNNAIGSEPPTPASATHPPTSPSYQARQLSQGKPLAGLTGQMDVSHPSEPQVSSSGLSNMFARTEGPKPSTQNAPTYASKSQARPAGSDGGFLSPRVTDQAVVAIGMSPVGLPLPANLPLPPGASAPGATAIEPAATSSKPKPFSYASALGVVANAPVNASGQHIGAPRMVGAASSTTPQTSTFASPPPSASSLSPQMVQPSTSPSFALGRLGHPNSPSFSPRVALSPNTSNAPLGSPNRLSSSVPSAWNMGRLEQHLPLTQTPDAGQGQAHPAHHPAYLAGSYARAPQQSSPLAPPPLQHSLSHSSTIPTRAQLNQGSLNGASLSPTVTSRSTVHPSAGHRTTGSGSNIFGTSPFGNNAIFLSSSHEDERGSFMPRSARDSSPARAAFEYTANRDRHGSSALADDDEDGTDDHRVLEEELVPSSLKHLLTPDEKARRESRSGSTKSGFFNPFNDAEDEEELDRQLEAEARQRYSQSVPAASGFPAAAFNRAPGSPPTYLGPGNPLGQVGSSRRPETGSSGGTLPSSNLAKHLLAGNAQQSPRVERGFATSGEGPQEAQSHLQAFGTSLPQGLAAGLSRLHMVPPGTEHTGYTPPASLVQSPPGQANFSNSQLYNASTPTTLGFSSSQNNINGVGNHSLLGANGVGRTAPSTSFGVKLPSLLQQQQHPGAGMRKGSSGYYDNTQVHVGSPLARHEIHGSHLASGMEHGSLRQHDRPHSQHEAEEDDLVFDLDV